MERNLGQPRTELAATGDQEPDNAFLAHGSLKIIRFTKCRRKGAWHCSLPLWSEAAPLSRKASIRLKLVRSDHVLTIHFWQKRDGGRRNAQRRHPRAYEPVRYSRLSWCGCAPRSTTQPIADLLAVVTLASLNEAPSRRVSCVSSPFSLVREASRSAHRKGA